MRDAAFSRFGRTSTCDRQTEQTDGHTATAYIALYDRMLRLGFTKLTLNCGSKTYLLDPWMLTLDGLKSVSHFATRPGRWCRFAMTPRHLGANGIDLKHNKCMVKEFSRGTASLSCHHLWRQIDSFDIGSHLMHASLGHAHESAAKRHLDRFSCFCIGLQCSKDSQFFSMAWTTTRIAPSGPLWDLDPFWHMVP